MDSFAFVIHPDAPQQDVARKHRRLGKVLSEPAIHFASRFWPPVPISHTTVAKLAATGRGVEGSLITVLHTAQRKLALCPAEVYHKKIAQELDVVVGVTCSGGVLL